MFASKSKPRTATFEQISPVHSYQDDKVIFKDGRVAVGYLVQPPEMEIWTPEDFYTMNESVQNALRVVPAESVVGKTDIFYNLPPRTQKNTGGFFEKKMNQLHADRLVLYDRTYLFISFAPSDLKKPNRTNAFSALVSRVGEKLSRNPFSGIVGTLSIAESAATEFTSALQGVGGVDFQRLLTENEDGVNEIEQIYEQYFNLEFAEQPNGLEREIINEPGGFAVGEKRMSIISLTGQGSDAHPAVRNSYGVTSPMLYPITSFLKCPHIVTQAFLVQDTKQALADLDADRRTNENLLHVPFLSSQDTQKRVEQIGELTLETRKEDKMLVSLHLSILLWDTNDERRQLNVTQTLKALRASFGAKGVVEAHLNLALYFALLPGNAYQIPDRWITTTADRASCYMFWTTSMRPEPGGLYLGDRHGNLVTVNLFNEDNDNQNAILVAPTGAGKSFTFADFITQRYEAMARQILLDLGGTYKNTVRALVGADFDKCYFEYDPLNPFETNPFNLPRNPKNFQWIYDEDKRTFHLSLITVALKGGKEIGLSMPERAVLSQLLDQYYRELNGKENLGQEKEDYPGMTSFYRFVKRFNKRMHEDLTAEDSAAEKELREDYRVNIKYFDINEFFLVLGQFVEGGRYAKIFNAPRDKDLSEYRLVCFDLKKVKDDPILYPLVGMIVTQLALDMTYKFPDDIKYIVLDEAWSLLTGALEDFIVMAYRTVRKNKGSITIITQGVNELLASPIGLVLIEQADIKIILRHKNESALMRLQVPFALTDHEIDQIRSLKLRSTKTSREIFIKQGSVGKVYTVEVPPEINPFLTSKASEVSAFNKLVRYFQYTKQVEVRDEIGNLVRDEQGQPVYKTVVQSQLAAAATQFAENQRLKSTKKREGGRPAA